jgi:excisionase family DNA binding protein
MSSRMERDPEPDLYSVNTVAKRLDVSADTVRRLIARGELSAIRIGVSVRVPAAEIESFVERRRGIPRRRRSAKCSRCMKRIVGPRLVVRGLFMCSSCMYELERGGIGGQGADGGHDEAGDGQPA